MPETHPNGQRKLFNWIIGLVGTVVVIGGTAWLGATTASVNQIHAELMKREGRISRLEAAEEQVWRRLDRIEAKIDKLLERENGK